jgi:hypothetical protein
MGRTHHRPVGAVRRELREPFLSCDPSALRADASASSRVRDGCISGRAGTRGHARRLATQLGRCPRHSIATIHSKSSCKQAVDVVGAGVTPTPSFAREGVSVALFQLIDVNSDLSVVWGNPWQWTRAGSGSDRRKPLPGDVVEKQNLQRGAGLRQAIEDDFAERRFCCLGSHFESEPLNGDGVRADVAEGSSKRRANREEPLPGTVDRAR